MSKIVQFRTRAEKVDSLMGQIAEFNRKRDELIAAATDEALVEVHSVLSMEMAAGAISLQYADVLQSLHGEIVRRGLNVVQLRTREAGR